MDWNERVAARSGLHVQIYALLVASTFPKNSGGMQGSEWSRVGEFSSLPGKLDDGKKDGSLGNTPIRDASVLQAASLLEAAEAK